MSKQKQPPKIVKAYSCPDFLKTKSVRYTVNVDWFELMLTGTVLNGTDLIEENTEKGKISFKRWEYGTPFFEYGYTMYYQGREFGKLFTKSKNKNLIDPSYTQIQLFNNILYEVGWLDDFKYIMKRMGWKIANVTRIDIALDGYGFLKMFDKWHKGDYQLNGKLKITTHMTGRRKWSGITIGSKQSAKQLVVYNKSAELGDRPEKAYIRKTWEKAGLIETNYDKNSKGVYFDSDKVIPVERLELRLRNEAVKMYENFDVMRLDDFEYLGSLLRTALEGSMKIGEHTYETGEVTERQAWIDFRKNDNKNKTRCTRVAFIDWERIGAQKLPTLSTKQAAEVFRMKVSSKLMAQVYFMTGERHYAQMAQELAVNANCLDWYKDRFNKWKNETAVRKSKGQLSYISAYETYEQGQQIKLYEKAESTATMLRRY